MAETVTTPADAAATNVSAVGPAAAAAVASSAVSGAGNMPADLPDTQPRPQLSRDELKVYGLDVLAESVASAAATAAEPGLTVPPLPSGRLAELAHLGLTAQDDSMGGDDEDDDDSAEVGVTSGRADDDDEDDEDDEGGEDDGEGGGGGRRSSKKSRGLTLDAGDAAAPRPAPEYSPWFVTHHRGPVHAVAFSHDGRYFATGSADRSVKVLDTTRIPRPGVGMAPGARGGSSEGGERPVVRTLYDHAAAVNAVAFHPNGTVLASGSDDAHIKLYDLTKGGVKRGFRYFQDAHPVLSISFHPSGDFLLAGTEHECVRIYDVLTFKCFTPTTPPRDELKGPVNKVLFAPQGNVFATAGGDGTLRLYDTVAGRQVNAVAAAHGGAPLASLAFSRNGRYLLTAGLDSLPRVWDLASGRVVQTFEGVLHRTTRSAAAFSANDDLVLSTDDATASLVAWDSRT
ncbi:cleavage stimulation factor, 3' pre-RNA, subunit 1, partial [Cladochytrium tenue]